MSLNMMLRFGGAKREADVPETLGQQIAAGIKAELEDLASRISLPSSAKLETMPGCPAPGFCKNKKKTPVEAGACRQRLLEVVVSCSSVCADKR